jgi:hypothetical protein
MNSRFARTAASLLPPAAAALALALAIFLAPPALRAAEPPQAAATSAAQQDAQAAQPSAKEQMEAYEKLAQPGEHHKHLGNLAGKWKVTGKSWMAPGQPPTDMSGSMEASWILGGRYLQEVHKGSFMGKPFEGRSLDGYDNTTHEYFSTWVDNMGTGVMVFRGSCDDPCKVLTETAEGPDPISGKVMKTKSVTTFVDPDTYRFEMYLVGIGKDGQDAKMMEIVAKRAR